MYDPSKQGGTERVHVRTYVIESKKQATFIVQGQAFYLCVVYLGTRPYSASLLLAVPHRSITFLFLIHSGDCAWCRQGEHGPLGRVLITLNLPLGLAATERRIPTRPPILPALYKGDPLPA